MGYSNKARFIVFCIVILIVSFGTVFAFSDVSDGNWAKVAIDSMENRGILNGYEDGSFKPSNKVNREEYAKILVKTIDIDYLGSGIKFEDISDDRWSKEYIEKSAKYFTAFISNGKYYFKPTDNAVREDIIVSAVCALGIQNEEVDLSILDNFKDKNDISPELRKYLAIAVKNDIIHGNDDGTLNPKGELTRAQVSQFMYNILERLDKGEIKKIALIEDSGNKSEEKEFLQKVSDGQVKKFAKRLQNGKKFTLTVNGNSIEGKMWDDGSIFELYPYFGKNKMTEQYYVNKKANSSTTLYGAEQSALVYGFTLEKVNDNSVKLKYRVDNKIYYDTSDIKDGHIDSDTLDNFVCFVLNTNKKVRVIIEEEEKENQIAEKQEILIKVGDGQVKNFAKKLTKGKAFKLTVNNKTVIGQMSDDGNTFMIFPSIDASSIDKPGYELYENGKIIDKKTESNVDEYIISNNSNSWKTMSKAQEEAKLYGFEIKEMSSNQVRLTYLVDDVTYYVNASVKNNSIDLDTLQNFKCFIFDEFGKVTPINDKNDNIETEIETRYLMKEVEDGQIAKFAKRLQKGKEFTLNVNGNSIEGNMWDNGYIFELYPYFEKTKMTQQYHVTKKIDSSTTLYGAEQSALVYGFEFEKTDNDSKVKLTYRVKNIVYYAVSDIDSGHMDTYTLDNFICFVLNTDEKVRVIIKDDEEEEVVDTPVQDEVVKMEKVPSNQVKTFAKKLTKGKYFTLKVNGNSVRGKMWDNGYLFELYPIFDSNDTSGGTQLTDQYVIDEVSDSWNTMWGTEQAGKLYGFKVTRLNDSKVRFEYDLDGITYYAEAKVEKEHAELGILQNFECFIFNKVGKVTIINETETDERYLMKQVEDGQISKFAKRLQKGKQFTLNVNGNSIEGKMWDNGSIFELYPYFGKTKMTQQYHVTKKIDSSTTLYGAEQSALVYGFEFEKTDNDSKVKLTYRVKNIVYYAVSDIDSGHMDTYTLDNFICFVLNTDEKVRVIIKYDEEEEVVDTPVQDEVVKMEKVPSNQVKTFAKKLSKGQYFTLKVNGNSVRGKMWDDGYLFELYPVYDSNDAFSGKQFTDQFIVDEASNSWNTMWGTEQAGKLYGFKVTRLSDSKVRFEYDLDGTTYYAEAKVESEHAELDVLQNFECFIFNKVGNVTNGITDTPSVGGRVRY